MNSSTEEQQREVPVRASDVPLKNEEVVSPTTAPSIQWTSTCRSSETNDHPTKRRRLSLKTQSPTSRQGIKKSRNKVSWNDDKNITYLQDDPSKMFPTEYKESDIWYSRLDYQQFLLDRIDTVERLGDERRQQASDASDKGKEKVTSDTDTSTSETTENTDDHHHCMRGLEPFRNRIVHQDLYSRRKLHHSTVIVEQIRQAMLGIKDPERFRFLVAPQSNLALHQAQRQAAMDEMEVYPNRHQSRRFTISAVSPPTQNLANAFNNSYNGSDSPLYRSVTTAAPMMSRMLRFGRSSLDLTKSSPSSLVGLTASLDGASKPSLFSADIRELQERNARRLMELYRKPADGMFLFSNESVRTSRSNLVAKILTDGTMAPAHSPAGRRQSTGVVSSKSKSQMSGLLGNTNIMMILCLLSLVNWTADSFIIHPSLSCRKIVGMPVVPVPYYVGRRNVKTMRWVVSDQTEGSDTFSENLSPQQGHEYSFYDEATIYVRAGSGGQGSSTYKKGVGNQNGPPDGGNGGKGGDVYLVVDPSLNTLAGLNPGSWRPNAFGGSGAARSGGVGSSSPMFKSFRAENGSDGSRQLKDGRSGKDAVVRIPPGTVVQEVHTVTDELGNEREILIDRGTIMLGSDDSQPGEIMMSSPSTTEEGSTRLLVAKGGEGGEGSGINYKVRGVHRPRMPPKGGERKKLRLTLKLVADVAVCGVPNAGKSTFLSMVTRAKPRIADYPFTTVIPNLGVWVPSEVFSATDDGSSATDGAGAEGLVLCDVPGLIEGASQGVGLGHAFLRHVERCHVILHLVDATAEDPVGDFVMLNQELIKYGTGQLAEMPQVVVVNKLDALEASPGNYKYSRTELEEALKNEMSHSRLMWMSAKEGDGVDDLMKRLAVFVNKVVSATTTG
ncbi:GTP1/OBG-domain containing protein [Nitzschia inconspicua]|uniref:GTP1/OBG-domain containing protein n=1 Tax=Nitzschia inconspicua TaxID=303405 RepID=A0A9K3Q3L2_9STRA|nr:GTP1/OBG-domain containing protein [Nitzschia inconspicua]